MPKQLRIGCIGPGRIADKQVETLRKLRMEGVSVIAAAGRNAERLQAFGARHGIDHLYTDWHQMLANPAVDAVLVCTPNNMHRDNTVEALRAGKHVLLEKPMATNAAEAEEMAAEAKKSRQTADDSVPAPVQSGSANAPEVRNRRHVRRYCLCARASAPAARHSVMGRVWAKRTKRRRLAYRYWRACDGNGALYNGFALPRHCARQRLYLSWDKPCTVQCKWGPWDHATYTVEDLGVGFVTFANGASMTVETSYAAHIENDVWNVQVMGTKGGGTTAPGKVFFDHGGYMQNATPAFLDTTDGFVTKMRHFCECILDGVQCEAPAEDGVALQKILDGLYVSAEQKREVVIR